METKCEVNFCKMFMSGNKMQSKSFVWLTKIVCTAILYLTHSLHYRLAGLTTHMTHAMINMFDDFPVDAIWQNVNKTTRPARRKICKTCVVPPFPTVAIFVRAI